MFRNKRNRKKKERKIEKKKKKEKVRKKRKEQPTNFDSFHYRQKKNMSGYLKDDANL